MVRIEINVVELSDNDEKLNKFKFILLPLRNKRHYNNVWMSGEWKRINECTFLTNVFHANINDLNDTT